MALVEYRKAWPSPGLRCAELMLDLAQSLSKLGREPDTVRQLRAEALSIRNAQLGPDHPGVAQVRALLNAR